MSGLLITFAFFAILPSSTWAAPIKLIYSNFFPPFHVQSQLAEAWCREVENRTNGRVKIEYYPRSKIIGPLDCYEGVVKGRPDIGFSVFAYTRDRFPVMGTVDLPLGYTTGTVATAVANEFYRKFKSKELNDTKVMYLHSHGPGLINTKGKPVEKLEDMKGLKFRTHGAGAPIIKALGGIPIPRPMPQTYKLIKEGKVQGATHPFESQKGWKLAELEDYVTACYSISYTLTFFVVMNKDKWNALPQDIKIIIEGINNEWLVKHGEAWDTSDTEGMKHFLKSGNQIIGLDRKEAARWKKAVAPIIDDHAKFLDRKGFNGRKIVDFAIKILKEMI